MKKTGRISLAALLSSSMVLAACGGGDDQDAAGDGGDIGRISIYSPETPDMTREMAEKFEEIHGGQVDVNYAGTNVLVNQMIAEMDNPQADLWYGGGGILPFESAIEHGFIESYTPELAEDWDVVQDDIKVRHEDWKWVGVEVFALGLIYNTDLVDEDELPQTWDELLDPRWEDELQMPNPAASGTATLFVISQLQDKGEEEGWDYLDSLVGQMNSMPDSGGAPAQAAASGEASMGIGFDFMAYQMKDRGESVDFHIPDNTPILVNPVALIKDGPNPEGAQKFVDFMLSEEGQQIKADWFHIPMHPDVEGKSELTMEDLNEVAQDLDIDWVVENYDEIRQSWRDRYQ
ncbi:ABC transporter substrate-binding protein [Alteribacter lacisalsi]|uniref:ABC transporter substrate-binding protein n=1 Tax=Alteribacter lacisalsi TaxID=2045244 RepID=A0A2W0HGT5_9BACI|nr:extracellular solute-binding protein [Alteribacter lacisalsi]PYZ95999.1 ABC transporter substrate-binding protein [Alteribacter lacisalsi]